MAKTRTEPTAFDLRKTGYRATVGECSESRSDPFELLLKFRHGSIYPFNHDTLCVEIERRRRGKRDRLAALPGLELDTDADDYITWKFPATRLDEIAAIVGLKKKRIYTEAERTAARERLAPYREKGIAALRANRTGKTPTTGTETVSGDPGPTLDPFDAELTPKDAF